jgi:hypothetical protein
MNVRGATGRGASCACRRGHREDRRERAGRLGSLEYAHDGT